MILVIFMLWSRTDLADRLNAMKTGEKAEQAQSLKELVALAKSAKLPLAFASAGNATSQHLSGEAVSMNIRDVLGRTVFSGKIPASNSGSMQLDVRSWAPGAYEVQLLYGEKGVLRGRILKL